MLSPPEYRPILPLSISRRWFPQGCSFGLYTDGKTRAPNVTSILSHFFPFDLEKWKAIEPNIDHAAVTRESAKRGNAVHLEMEEWLSGKLHKSNPVYESWTNPLKELVSRATATLGVELPVFKSFEGIGSYAGSCDALMLVKRDVVVIDYKTKRPGKNVYVNFCKKQKLQLAAYSLAINANYGSQLISPVSRISLLYSHPDPNRPVTVVSAQGEELSALQSEWLELLRQWTCANQDSLSQFS